MNDPKYLIRQLYQHVRTQANLPGLQPRPLPTQEIGPGTSEFAVTLAPDSGEGGGWGSGGLLVPVTLAGYIAVHYAASTDQSETLTDHAAIFRALNTFTDVAGDNPHFRGMGPTPADWYLNQEVAEAGKPLVLTLLFSFSIEFDLTLKEGSPP